MMESSVTNKYVDNSLNAFLKLSLLSLFLATSLSLIPSEIYLLILLISITGVWFLLGEKFAFGIIIITYLTSLSEFIGGLRNYLIILVTFLLLLLFLNRYGLKIKSYPKIPVMLLIYIACLIFTLSLSTFFSVYQYDGFISILRMSSFLLIVYFIYALLFFEEYFNILLYSIFFSVLMLSVRMLLDVYVLGIQVYFARTFIGITSELYGSSGYTGFTIFFISSALLIANIIIKKLSNTKSSPILLFFLFIHLVVLILANSRALIVSTLISTFFIFALLRPKLFFKSIFILSLLSFVVYLSIPPVQDAIDLYLRLDTVSQRDMLWESGIDVIQDYTLLGVGPGVFDKYFYTYAPSDVFNFFDMEIWRLGIPNPHNLFLFYWAENGIAGLLTAIGFFIVFFHYAIKTISIVKQRSLNELVFVICITGIGIGMLFRSFFESGGILYYGYITTDLPFWLAFAMLLNIKEKVNMQSVSGNRIYAKHSP